MTSTIRIRRPSSHDKIEDLTTVAYKAWVEDPLYAWLNPEHYEHPDDYQLFWKTLLSYETACAGKVLLVAKSESDDAGLTVVGFSIWERHGMSNVARSWQGDSITNCK